MPSLPPRRPLVRRTRSEADTDLYLNALIEIGLVLFVITLIINSLSRLLIWSMGRTARVTAATTEPEVVAAA